jgi:shikimate kinase
MKNIHIFTAMRIYLIGYMASGKSNLGQVLAEKLGYSFLDLDYLFEKRFRISVLDFFEKYDEDGFRKIERMLLHETRDHDNVVISTGGGTPCYFDNMHFINEAGISIYLHWEIPALVNRLRQIKRERPLLKKIPAAELEGKVRAQMEQRAFYYNQADYTINTENLNMETILEWIRGRSAVN